MGPLVGPIAAQPDDEQLDDWLGTISDDDWDEGAAERAELRRAIPADQELTGTEDDAWRDRAPDRAAADDDRTMVVWRRRVAGLAFVGVLVLAVVVGVLLLHGGEERPVAPVGENSDTTSTPTETGEASTPTTPSTTTTTPSATTPDANAFSLPEGTKLQSEDADPAEASDLEVITDPEVVTALQQALVSAGYDPGDPDGTFGPRTEAAVVAFQQDNGLSPDGIVGPETASALNAAVAGG
jgi:hypothetical protein